MADGNDDPRADDSPGPAHESCEAAELAGPAERSGHVAVGDGRHMFVWGGYKVSGGRAALGRAVRPAGPGAADPGPRPLGCVPPAGGTFARAPGRPRGSRLLSPRPPALPAARGGRLLDPGALSGARARACFC